MATRSKKRKIAEITDQEPQGKEIEKETKKIKLNNDDDSQDDSKENAKNSSKKNDILAFEELLKSTKDSYEKILKGFDEKEQEQNRVLEDIEEIINTQKQEETVFLKCIRQVANIVKGDENIESLVQDMEKECQELKEKVKSHEKLKRNLADLRRENEELKRNLEENRELEVSHIQEKDKEVEEILQELKSKERRERELQSVVELYYSLTNLKINLDYASQDPISEFHCNIKGDSNKENGNKKELEFKLKDNEDNEIEYNPIRCNLSKEELNNHSYLQEEIVFDMSNLKKFFKTIFEVVNKE